MAVLKPVTDELSECGESLFQMYMQCCEDFVKCIKEKQACHIVAVDDAVHSDAVPCVEGDAVPYCDGDGVPADCLVTDAHDVGNNGMEHSASFASSAQCEALAVCSQLQTRIDNLLRSKDGFGGSACSSHTGTAGDSRDTPLDSGATQHDHCYGQKHHAAACDMEQSGECDTMSDCTANDTDTAADGLHYSDELSGVHCGETLAEADVETGDCWETDVNSVLMTDAVSRGVAKCIAWKWLQFSRQHSSKKSYHIKQLGIS